MTLRSDCPAVDVGMRLPNINDGSSGAGPDLGAFERGQPLPVFGPRADTTALLTVSPASVRTGESASLSWTTSGATAASITPLIGDVSTNGSTTVSPATTT